MKNQNFVYQGKIYSTYYQLEKVMGINRRTIQYRHEKLGLTLDELIHYEPEPKINRLGDKRFIPQKKKETPIFADYEAIIHYPKVPEWQVISNDQEKTEASKASYSEWLEEAPEVLVLREKIIYQKDLEKMLEEEKGKYFFASTYHEEAKQKIEIALALIENILEKRDGKLSSVENKTENEGKLNGVSSKI
ncbi:hypothetical protein QJV45_14095 [Listeria booriae]|uniref:hypothetical protein n=1 Tax=Listeria booriae TaxID=1552123 RepID=UPI00288032D2|nr:hypothetical protein [Listeria booriae]MDT0111610.1 hypothetical protein [Listeria booriae]